jgi:hypothetical protein
LPLFSLNPKETPKELFGREEEIGELTRLIKAKRWIAILGPRMVGKTSLIKAANKKLEGTGIKAVYVNLWGARGTHGLLNALALSKPQELDTLREEAKQVIHTIATDQSIPIIERIRQTAETREAYSGPLRKALRTMHQITLKLFTPRSATGTLLGDVYILINEEGIIDAVFEEEIIKHPEIRVTSM